MEIAFFYGPEKIPFGLNEKGMAEAASAIPFHGIISKSLLTKFRQLSLSSETWEWFAHRIDDADRENQDQELTRLREAARECKVLSFSQSALCVLKYVQEYCRALISDEGVGCEFWNIKEGHTSSVWKITITTPDQVVTFILNVARDGEAGVELKETAARMQAMVKGSPAINMAKVYDIGSVHLDYGDRRIEVVITRNEYIARADEIHLITDRATLKQQYVLVKKFLSSANNPAQITSIYGRIFTEDECSKINRDVAFFMEQASPLFSPQINVNDGDIVWNGTTAIIVAIS